MGSPVPQLHFFAYMKSCFLEGRIAEALAVWTQTFLSGHSEYWWPSVPLASGHRQTTERGCHEKKSWNWLQAKAQYFLESKTAKKILLRHFDVRGFVVFFPLILSLNHQFVLAGDDTVKLIISMCCPRQNPLQFLDKLLSHAHVFINLESSLPIRISCLRLTNIICIFLAKMIMGIKLPFLYSQIKLNNYMAFGINRNTRFLFKYFSPLNSLLWYFWIQCLNIQCN